MEMLIYVSIVRNEGKLNPHLSSFDTSLDSRRLSPEGRGGGDDDGAGEVDFCRDERREFLDGVL